MLGIVSLVALFLCGLGVITAIIGLIIGIVAVIQDANRGRAWWGIALSALTLILAVIAIVWFVTTFGECLDATTQQEAQRCIEEKLGVPVSPRR